MADAGRDITEQEEEHPLSGVSKDLAHAGKRESFTTVNKDFGVGNDDVPNLDTDPILPGRRRVLFMACMCILGKLSQVAPYIVMPPPVLTQSCLLFRQ